MVFGGYCLDFAGYCWASLGFAVRFERFCKVWVGLLALVGFVGCGWVLLEFPGVSRVSWGLLGFGGLCGVLVRLAVFLLGFGGFGWLLVGFGGRWWVFLGFLGFSWVSWFSLGFAGLCWVRLGFGAYCWALLGFDGRGRL